MNVEGEYPTILKTMSDYGTALAGGAVGITQGVINNLFGAYREDEARRENFRFNEMAAKNADTRTRALYQDIYSPSALLRQYGEAGLSPSLMFGGTPGQGGASGAQGAGTSQGSTYIPISLLEGAQIAQMAAETEKTKAETANIQSDTAIKDLQKQFDEYRNLNQEAEAVLTLTWIKDKETGETNSLYDYAKEAGSYKEFIDKVKSIDGGEKFNQATGTEKGQRVLRTIYENQYRFERDIEVLSQEQTNASFQKSILNALSKEGYQDMNAKAAVKQLEASAQTSELTEEQKKAWNDLIKRLPEGTTRDVVIVLAMILGQYAGKAKINTGGGD